jgi:trehalose 6-phosphate phosphatase
MSQPFFDAIHEVGDRIMQAPHVLLCLDYDGTLTHFVANPVGARLSPQMERSLLALAEDEAVAVAIVSGRDRADLQGRVDIPGIIYVGNHGLEISGPGFVFIETTAAACTETLKALAEQLAGKLQAIEGAKVDNKGLTISVHFRQVAPEAWDEVRRVLHAALAGAVHPFILTTGEKVYEIRPRTYWNKGTAVNWIREKLGKPEVLPIYVGDDVTDEDAFKALTDGITVKVRPSQDTAARYTLEGVAEVRKFLEWLEDLLRHKAQAHPCGAGHEA